MKRFGGNFLLLINLLFAVDVGIITDTLSVTPEYYTIPLSKQFILEPLLKLKCSNNKIPDYTLDKLQGVLKFDKPQERYTCIIKYRFLINPPPIQVGPQILSLPLVDALSIDSLHFEKRQQSYKNKPNSTTLISTGTVFRSVEVSPFGGTDFTGGLQLQVQGKLTHNMDVTGVLSDRNLSIQPEGTTQSLDEIDNIYLRVGHPKFEILAGDVVFNERLGLFYSINRKLNGLTGEFHNGHWRSSAVFARSEGTYFKKLFTGIEGKQGPYYFTSEDGNRNIVVQAGTEQVWLDGERLIRGETQDYTMDYMMGELTFTPKRLIHFDSEIFVEYQYSDFRYNQQVMGATVTYSSGKKGKYTLSWFRENDVFTIKSSGFTSEELEVLELTGDGKIQLSGATEDETGHYIMVDSIFVYAPDAIGTHYSVNYCQNQQTGTYRRKISENGDLYFEYIPENDRILLMNDVDLYTSYRQIQTPESHDLFQTMASWNIESIGNLELEVALSGKDKNTISTIDDNDNFGLGHHIRFLSEDVSLLGDARLKIRFSDRKKESRYRSIQRDQSVTFNSDWNILQDENSFEHLISGGVELSADSLGSLSADWNELVLGETRRKRLKSDLALTLKYIPEMSASVNQVTTNSWTFFQHCGKLLMFDGKFHPYISFDGERQTNRYRYDHTSGGIRWDTKKGKLSMGVGKRTDWSDSKETGLELTNTGVFGELDWDGKTRSGWKQRIVFRRRILNNLMDGVNKSFNLGQLNIGYISSTTPIHWDLQAKMEETFVESRAVVYDSVGSGLGTHRYDKDLKEYIPDLHGSFIAYTVLTGVREPTTHINGTQKLLIDLRKTSWTKFHPIKLRLTGTMDYQGKGVRSDYLISPTLMNENITRSRWNLRQELDYRPKRSSRRIRQWTLLINDLNGLDPRGNDLRLEKEIGVEFFEPIASGLQTIIRIDRHRFDVSSEFSELRNRDGEGTWIEAGLKHKSSSKGQMDAVILAGSETGTMMYGEFTARSYGIRWDSVWFLGKTGRLQIRTEWNNVKEVDGAKTIPPEALNGLPIGTSFRSTIQSYIMFGDHLSLNISLNYLDDQRYDRLVSMSAELRANL